ncbi:MAG: alpha/beta fold hydrolase [Armatimonadetes bacterium]|nr:alpha/beta fold hydrolase [Armatimonadota bacterium]
MRAGRHFRWLPVVIGLLPAGAAGRAADPEPYPRVSREAFQARLPFFDYDRGIPLEGRVVRQWESERTLRQKLVFRGAQGFLVPATLEFPRAAPKPFPLVLLLHGWSGNREDWWRDDGYATGGLVRRSLLEAGFGVLALDAATHGERSTKIDFQHVNPFEDPKAPPRRNYFTFAEIAIQTVKDHRRALDYLAERGDVAMDRIGLTGYSMGGMNAFYLLAVEPRVRAAVACVPPLHSPGYGPCSPVDYTWGVGKAPLLMIMGRRDELANEARGAESYRRYIQGPNTEIRWHDAGHKLPPAYVRDVAPWLQRHLPGPGSGRDEGK